MERSLNLSQLLASTATRSDGDELGDLPTDPEQPRISVAWQSVVDQSAVVMLLVDGAGVIRFESAELARATGWPAGALLGRRCFDAIRVGNAQGIQTAFDAMLRGELGRMSFEFEMTALNGEIKVFAATLLNSINDPRVQAIVLSGHEITARKAFERRLRRHANHDALTGLFNRRTAMRTLSGWIDDVTNGGAKPAVLLFDVDGFKGINDAYGHAVGDAMLVELGQRLRALDPDSHAVARIGGDELLLLVRCEDVQAQVPLIAQRALEALRQPVLADWQWVFATASVGIAAFPDGGKSADDLLRHADVALYQAKDAGRNTARWFDREATEALREKTVMRRELAHALPNNELRLHFQPIVNVVTNTVHSHECLLRWQHGERGLMVARDFIGHVDGAGLAGALTDWVIREAFEASSGDRIISSRPLTVNIHPRLFLRADFAADLLRSLHAFEIDPARLEIEITEEDFVRAADVSPATITALSAEGVHIIIDDFGTGFSKFGYLARFPVHAIKIDRSFVSQIGSSERCDAFISAMIGLAAELGVHAIGEGVETHHQADFLKLHGCVLQQGFLWGRPKTAGATSDDLANPY